MTFPDPRNIPGAKREDAEGNDKTYENEVVTAYWLEHYCSQLCTLCGNSGIIDTRGIRSAAGIEAGRVNYCICPNGQALRWFKAPFPAVTDMWG